MHLTICGFGLFICIADIIASSDTMLSEKKKRKRKPKNIKAETLSDILDKQYKHVLVMPIMYHQSGKIILPNTKHTEICTPAEKKIFFDHMLDLYDYLIDFLMFQRLAIEVGASLESLLIMENYQKKYITNIKNIFIQAMFNYIVHKITYKQFINNIMYEIFDNTKIPQTYIEDGITLLTNMQELIKLIHSKTNNQKVSLSHIEEIVYTQEVKVNNLLKLYEFMHDVKKDVKDSIEFQREFAGCVAARFFTEEHTQPIFAGWLAKHKNNLHGTCFATFLSDTKKNALISVKEKYGPEVAGEVVMYMAMYDDITYNWKEEDILKKAKSISVKLKKEENWRKDIADKLMLEENKAKKSSHQQSKQDSSTKAQQEDHEDHQKSTSDDSAEESLQENQIEAQPIHLNHLVFSSNGATGPYTFHPRVVRWDNNDLKMLQQSLNYSSNIAYHNQPKKDLLFAKYLHDIFPVARIWGSKYRDEFFSESENAFNGKTYTAEAVMVIKEQEKESKKKTIRGQVEIGFDREKKNMIYHLYFKPT
ncbi:hypothetical protein NEFER01_2248, partial [Nematocida sp. LUAm1]